MLGAFGLGAIVFRTGMEYGRQKTEDRGQTDRPKSDEDGADTEKKPDPGVKKWDDI